MDFEFSEDERAFRAKVADFIREQADKPGVRTAVADGTRFVDSPPKREFMKAMGAAGYLGISWPREYGGQGKPIVYDYIVQEEVALQAAPAIGKGIGIIGRSIMNLGTEEQKKKFLPLILRGEIEWALGYSEPEAGSDLASLKLKAVRHDNGWRINGQKRFTSSAHFADWYWLAARTDFNVPKHKGITLFLVDMKSPGITVNPMYCMDGDRTNEVFLDDVWVPDSQVIGEPGKGFYYISKALDFERHTLFPIGRLQRMYRQFLEWVQTAVRDGKPVREDSDVRRALARLTIALEVSHLHSLRVLVAKDPAEANVASAMNKIAATEFYQTQANVALDLIGPGAWLGRFAEDGVGRGIFAQLYLTGVLHSVGAGTNEIQRNIVARRGLGLPNPT